MKFLDGHLTQEKDDGPKREERNSQPAWDGPNVSKARGKK